LQNVRKKLATGKRNLEKGIQRKEDGKRIIKEGKKEKERKRIREDKKKTEKEEIKD